MDDVTDEFSKIEIILTKFYAWRKTDMPSYKDAFVSICLPKVSLIVVEILSLYYRENFNYLKLK